MCEALLTYFLNDTSLGLQIYVLIEDFMIGVHYAIFFIYSQCSKVGNSAFQVTGHFAQLPKLI